MNLKIKHVSYTFQSFQAILRQLFWGIIELGYFLLVLLLIFYYLIKSSLL